MISNPVGVFGVLSLVVFGMVWLQQRYKGFKKLGAAAASILAAMVLSNAGVLPGESGVYDFFTRYGVLAGIVLILLGVDIRSVWAAGSTLLKAFIIGAAGSTLGAITMAFLLHSSLGDDTYKLAGQFAATYVGGGMNYAALGYAFGTTEELFTAGIAADVIITAFWLVTCLAAPLLLKSEPGGAASEKRDQEREVHSLEKALVSSGKAVALVDVAALVAITVSSIWVSTLLGRVFPAIPGVAWLTTMVLLLAQIPQVKRLSGGTVMGNFLIMLFLACNGARSVVGKIVEVGPEVFYFAVGTVAIHGLVIFGVGRLMRIDAGTLAIASLANVGGSSQALAGATARNYNHLILPGIACGLIGTALGNYLGLAVGNLLKILL